MKYHLLHAGGRLCERGETARVSFAKSVYRSQLSACEARYVFEHETIKPVYFHLIELSVRPAFFPVADLERGVLHHRLNSNIEHFPFPKGSGSWQLLWACTGRVGRCQTGIAEFRGGWSGAGVRDTSPLSSPGCVHPTEPTPVSTTARAREGLLAGSLCLLPAARQLCGLGQVT